MKKAMTCIFALVIIALTSSALASALEGTDTFVFRDSIMFGYSKDTVKSLEQVPMLSETDDSLEYGPVEIMGGSSAILKYRFNKDGGLAAAGYEIVIGQSEEVDANNIHNSINSALIAKYGEPSSPKSVSYISDSIDSCMTSWYSNVDTAKMDLLFDFAIVNSAFKDKEGWHFWIIYSSYIFENKGGTRQLISTSPPNTGGL